MKKVDIMKLGEISFSERLLFCVYRYGFHMCKKGIYETNSKMKKHHHRKAMEFLKEIDSLALAESHGPQPIN